MSPIIISLFIVMANFGFVLGARILFLPMHMTGSHKKSMVPLADELANQGHHVTFWNTFFEAMPIKPTNPAVIDRDLVTKTTNQLYNEQWVWHNGTDIMDAWNSAELKSWSMLLIFGLSADICKHAIDQHWDKIDQLINENWDLVVVDTLFNPCGMLISERSSVPRVLISTSFSIAFTNRHLSVPMPIASFTANTIDYQPTKFWHRLQQFSVWYVYDIVNTQIIQWMFRWMLHGVLPESFNWKRFDQNALLSLHATPTTIYEPNPSVPDHFSLGDTPCPKTPKSPELPEDYRTFVEDPRSKGTIMAAFGHIVRWKMTPRADVMQLHQAFSQLVDYRIIWQYNGDPLPELPNVKITTWLPQKELLYHPKTKMFLSHMGLKSVMEGLCAAVPFAALPVYAEQPMNARMMILRQKTGSILDKKNLQTDDLVVNFLEVLTNPSYKTRISKLRSMLMDKPKNPVKDAAFRINFAMNHQEKAYLWRIRGRNLNLLAYYNLDILASIVLIGLCVSAFVARGLCSVIVSKN